MRWMNECPKSNTGSSEASSTKASCGGANVEAVTVAFHIVTRTERTMNNSNQLPLDLLSLLIAQQNTLLHGQPNPPAAASALPPQPPSAPSTGVALASTFDLSGISPDVIRQVREEYQAQLRAQQLSQPLVPQPNSPAPTSPTYDSRPVLKTDDGGTATSSQNPKLAPSGPIKGILKKRPSETSDLSRPITSTGESRRPVASATLTRAAEGMDLAVVARLDEIVVEGRVFDVVRGLKRAQVRKGDMRSYSIFYLWFILSQSRNKEQVMKFSYIYACHQVIFSLFLHYPP